MIYIEVKLSMHVAKVLWWISCQDTIKVKLPRYYGNQVGKVMYKSSCKDIVGVKVLKRSSCHRSVQVTIAMVLQIDTFSV